MTQAINLRKQVSGDVEDIVSRLTEALKARGFGILTRIDLDAKIKEKLGKKLPKTVILGACNPQFAYDAFQQNTDVASLLPCNAVVRDVGNGLVSIELAKPSIMMDILDDKRLFSLGKQADDILKEVLEKL